MQEIIYKSERYFTIFDVVSSHGQLLLRSQKNETHLSNIDIIFFDAAYIQLVSSLYGISIRRVNKNENIIYDSVTKYLKHDNNHLFEIESGAEKFYIAASFFKVFENELAFNETSLGFEFKGRNKEIAGS